jgi:hypothetical protein
MQKIFGTAALGLRDITVAVIAGFVVFPVIVFEKWMHSQRKKQ